MENYYITHFYFEETCFAYNFHTSHRNDHLQIE
jgi:hypothetical protein